MVGSGSSGAAVAGRLAQSGASVIVLEAGKTDEKFLVKKPGMIGPMHAEPEDQGDGRLGLLLDRRRSTSSTARCRCPRGKVVGGSSSINGMVYVRGNRANYDSWAAEGNTGWDADSVNAAYKRMEDFEDGANDYRGAGGPIRITRNKIPQEGTLQFIQATSDALGVKMLDDYNAEHAGGHRPDAAERRRRPALQRLARLHPQPRRTASLELQTEVLVTKIVVENGRRRGRRRRRQGRLHAHRPRRQGGHPLGRLRRAPPQLLMLSGDRSRRSTSPTTASPRSPTSRWATTCTTTCSTRMTFHATSATLKGNAALLRARAWLKELLRPGKSFLANSVFESVGFVRTSQATDVPDLQLHLLPWSYVSPNQDEPIRHDVDPRTALTVLATLIYPRSRGTLRLASGDPMAAPLIDPRYLDDPADLEVLAEGSEMVREIMGGAAFGGAVKEEIHPGAELHRAGPPSRDPQPGDVGLPRCRHLPDGRRRARRRRARTSRSAASTGCASPTPRSCRPSPAATRTLRRS